MSAEDKKKDGADKPEANDSSDMQADAAAVTSSVPDTEPVGGQPKAEEGSVTDPEPEPEPAPAAESVTVVQNTPPRSDGFARFVSVVALLVAIAVLALSQFPQVPRGSAAKLAAVEQKVAGFDNAPAADTAGDLSLEVAELRTKLAAAEDRLANLSLLMDEVRTTQEQSAEAEGAVADTSDLEERIAALAAQIEVLNERPDQTPTTVTVQSANPAESQGAPELEARLELLTAELAELKSELSEIEGRQADIAGSISSGDESVREEMRAAIDAASTALTAQVSTIAETARETTEAGNNQLAGKAAMVLAAGRLKDAASGSAPFSGAWQALEALGVAGADYPAIPDAAATGVPTLTELRASFDDEASRAIVADKVGNDGTWVDGALKRMGSLVKVRRTGELEGDEVEAVVARAEVRLAEDDLSGALTELEVLQGAAAAEIASWVDNARRRVALNADVEALQASMLADLAGNQ